MQIFYIHSVWVDSEICDDSEKWLISVLVVPDKANLFAKIDYQRLLVQLYAIIVEIELLLVFVLIADSSNMIPLAILILELDLMNPPFVAVLITLINRTDVILIPLPPKLDISPRTIIGLNQCSLLWIRLIFHG